MSMLHNMQYNRTFKPFIPDILHGMQDIGTNTVNLRSLRTILLYSVQHISLAVTI